MMKSFIRSGWNQALCLLVCCFFSCLSNSSAQTPSVVVTPMAYNFYKIGTTNLGPEDLVFYRFSDGFEQTAMVTTVNSDASVQRQFKTGSVGVSAFVAKKNGPIGLAVGDIGNPTCSNCKNPTVGLTNGEYIRLRSTSWDAFVDPANPAPLNDTKTTPTCVTPALPWFILPVTVRAPQPNTYIELTIPPGMTIVGAVVKDKWKEVFVSSSAIFTISDPDVAYFQYPTLGKVKVYLTSAFNNEFNIYFYVKSSTLVGDASTFSAQVFDPNGGPLGAPSMQKIVTHHDPHDPNVLIPSRESTCLYHVNNTPSDFRVDFQNIGAGVAENVVVRVNIDSRAMNGPGLPSNLVFSSNRITSIQKEPDYIKFTFNAINLQGVGQDPQPELDQTKGWVQFTINYQPCIPMNVTPIVTQAFITFVGVGGGFTETIATNSHSNVPIACLPIDALCPRSSIEAPETITEVKCYPTFIQNIVHVDAPALDENSSMVITISDLSGKIYQHNTTQTMAGTGTPNILDTSALPNGMYVVQVRTGKQVQVFKVIKE